MPRYEFLSVFLFFWTVAPGAKAQFTTPVFPALEGQQLLDSVVHAYKPAAVLDYDEARDFMYGTLYKEGDSVRCVYSGHALFLPDGVDPSTFLYMNGDNDGINTEHAYPQSKGASVGNPKSDMHHLFPTRTGVNTARQNFPYADIPDEETEKWYFRSQELASVPSENADLFSEKRNGAFEVREDFKGNVARAVFYFYTMYRQEATAADPLFFEAQRETLCGWHFQDAVDSLEWERTFAIASKQDGKLNPFILDCSLAARSYCPQWQANCPPVSGTMPAREAKSAWQVSPNPTSGRIEIRLSLENAAEVRVSAFDALGRSTEDFAAERYLPPGEHVFSGEFQTPGVKFIRLAIFAKGEWQIWQEKILVR